MVPLTRTVGAGCAAAMAQDAASSPPAKVIFIVVVMMSSQQKRAVGKPAARSMIAELSRGRRSLRRIDTAADGDVWRGQRSIGFLLGRGDEHLGPDLEVGGAARRILGDRDASRHENLLLAVLVLDQNILAVLAGHGRGDI